jgi:hypothetical protein
MQKTILLLLLLPIIAWSQSNDGLSIPQSTRVLGLGGAYVAVADDPQAGLLNPAGIKWQSQIGFDGSFTAITNGGRDHIVTAYSNPSSGSKTAFGMGTWFQGLTRTDKYVYYVPYVGTSWRVTKSTTAGMVIRNPIIKARRGSDKTRYQPVVDASILQKLNPIQIGVLMERAMGGSLDLIPRRLRAGAALIASRNFLVVYEWWGDEKTDKTYAFKYNSSHAGAEVVFGKYIAIRGGYVWGEKEAPLTRDTDEKVDDRHISFGGSFGMLNGGWQLNFAGDIPISEKGNTTWSAGASYRL